MKPISTRLLWIASVLAIATLTFASLLPSWSDYRSEQQVIEHLASLGVSVALDNDFPTVHLGWRIRLFDRAYAIYAFENEKITDSDLSGLPRLKHLAILNLDDTSISDSGLRHLRSVRTLEFLSLSGTMVTDAGLDDLRSLDRLRTLSLQQTRVTTARVRQLVDELMQCQIDHSHLTIAPP